MKNLLYKKVILRVLFFLLVLVVGFVIGLITLHSTRRYFDRRYTQPERCRKLMDIAITMRSGNTNKAIKMLDSRIAEALYLTAYNVPNDQMTNLPEEVLNLWQQAKEYYKNYEVYEGTMVRQVKDKLEYVPWTKYQQARWDFQEKYMTGELVAAPKYTITHWFVNTISKEDTQGKVILLDFWNIDCKPCVSSLPKLQEIHDKYIDKGLVVIACTGGLKDKTHEFLKKHSYTFPVGMSNEQTWLNYAVKANPTYFLIDRQGRLAWGSEHKLPTDEEIANMLKE